MGKLNTAAIEQVEKPGMYPDGQGLYLQVTGRNSKSWIYRYSLNGRARWLGLGSARDVSLAKARAKRDKARVQVREGIDLIEEQKRKREQAKLETIQTKSFRDYAEDYIAAHEPGWRSAKHAAQWQSTLKTYGYPVFGALPVRQIDTELVLKCLRPIWSEKPETANRVRGRIEAILSAAKVEGLRDGENPARWRGHLDQILLSRAKVRPPRQFAALPYSDIGAFISALRGRDAIAARSLEFLILTASRTSEVLGANWNEIDIKAGIWTVPSTRMKSGRAHRVPLSDAALAVLQHVRTDGNWGLVFPSVGRPRPLSNMAMAKLLERMGHPEITVHGFRATFRTWAAEQTSYPREVVEAALSHVNGDKVEAAYQRGDFFDKRRQLMSSWSDFCAFSAEERF